MKPVARWVKRLGRWAAALVGVAALLLALGIGAFRLAIDLLPGYQQRIVERVREATGLTLEFDSVYARIGRYGPELVFRGARVLPASGDEPLVSAQSGRVSLSILRTLWFRRIEVGRFSLVRPRLNFVIHTDGTVQMVGQFALQTRPESEREPLTLERLPRGRFAVRDATLDVLDLRARQGRFELTGADIEIERRGDHVTAQGQVELPEHLGSKLEFEADVQGDLADAASLAWRGSLDAYDLDFEQWAALLPESFRVPAAGHGSFELSARGTGRELAGLRLQPSIEDLRFAGAQGEFRRITGDIRVQQRDGTISVHATGLELSRRGAPWRPTSLEARLTREGGRIVAASLRADYLRIENIAALAAALPVGALRERIEALAPRGELFGLDVTLSGIEGRRVPDVTGRLRFADVGFEPIGRAAGITGLDGAIEGRGAGGVVHVATRNATIKWPLQWRALVDLPTAEGRAEWSRFGDGARVWLDNAFVDTGHGTARGKLRMLLRPGSPPLMDLDATAADFDLTQTWRYLQIERLSPRTVAWLDAAFRAGRVPEARVQVTGPTRGFPYREGQGRFHATGRATGVNLFYAPGWPELRGIESTFTFNGPAMQAFASRGSIGGVAFTQAEVHSADLRDAIIAVRANARADAGRAIRLLQASPLAPSFGTAFADLSGTGPVSGELVMYLPIKEFERRVVTVMATLDGVTLRHKTQPIEATDISGKLWVRNREIQAPALTGRLLGGALRATIATTDAGQRQSRHPGQRAGQRAGRAAAADRAAAGQCGPVRHRELARFPDRRAQRGSGGPGARHAQAQQRPARHGVEAARAVCERRGCGAPADDQRELRRRERPAGPGAARARRARAAAVAKPPRGPAGRAGHRRIRRHRAVGAATRRRIVGHGRTRVREPDGPAGVEMGRAARAPAAGMARWRGPVGRGTSRCSATASRM